MSPRPLQKSFSLDGDWWLPDDPGHSVTGRLAYAPGRIELDLRGILARGERVSISPYGYDKSYAVVHGRTDNGQAITLLQARRVGVSAFPGQAAHAELVSSSYAFLGLHAKPDQLLSTLGLRVPGLHLWFGIPLIDQRQSSHDLTATDFHVRIPKLAPISIDSISANIEWVFGYDGKTGFYDLDISMLIWVGITPCEPKPLQWFLDQKMALETFFSILADAPMASDCLHVHVPERPGGVDLLISMEDVTLCPYDKDYEFAISNRDLHVRLEQLLPTWFDLYPKVKTPSQLAVSIIGSKGLWPHVEFLSLMQALEGFHRALYPGTYMPEPDYEEVKASLGNAIPTKLDKSHKDALRSKIKYGNQIALRKRLDELVGTLGNELRGAILGDARGVPRTWVDTRNYFTHWDDALRSNVLSSEDMHNASTRLRQLLRNLYLKHAGVPEESILSALRNTSRASLRLSRLNRNK